ncbi:MAG: glycerophosphodiester phosphodiesterase family protein [Gammaproteobacteria bacterium]
MAGGEVYRPGPGGYAAFVSAYASRTPPPAAPVLVAHRGHAAVCPENTLPALDSAVAAGARWLEVDVQLTADGVPVLLHDDDLARTSGQAASVFSMTAADLADVPVGEPARFGDRFSQVRAPTLPEFARWLAGQEGVRGFVEIKTESLERFGRQAVADAVLEAGAPARGRWVPLSYDADVLDILRRRGAPAPAWVVREFDDEAAATAADLGVRWLFRNHERMSPGPLPAGPWTWVPYEVASVALARDLMARGATWLETMAVARLAGALGCRG